MSENLTIQFFILVEEDKVLVDDLFKKPDVLLNYYLSEENPTDSSFQGGYGISIDGERWNGKDEFYFDMFAYTLNWLRGIEKLLLKEITQAEVGFWEESTAKAILKNAKELEIIDATVSGRILAESTIVNFEQFCKLLLIESRKYELLAYQIKDIIIASGLDIDAKRGHQIIQEMCADEFRHYNNSIENLINRKNE